VRSPPSSASTNEPSDEIKAERARELRGFAEARAQEERTGNGVDRSQPYGTWDRQMTERRNPTRRHAH
jgi:hypothetical protein